MNAPRDEDYHALLSPSSAHTWLACAPAIALGMDQPNKSSAYADEGTAAHTVAADCLTFEGNATDLVGEMVPGKMHQYEVTPAFAEAVQCYIELVRERVNAYEMAGYFVQLEVEQEVPIGHITGEEGARGTSDAVILAFGSLDRPNIIEVIDLKFGQGVQVSAVNNPQGMLYALGAIEKFKPHEFQEVRITISQPRISTVPSEWTISAKELDELSAYKFEPAALNALSRVGQKAFKLEEFSPGEKQCKFCKAKAICPALKAYTEEAMAAKFDDLEEPYGIDNEIMQALTLDELAAVYPRLKLVEDWITAVRGRVSEALLSGEKLSGLKVVRGKRGNRSWSDAAEAETTLKGMRIKSDVMYKQVLQTPTVLEKALAESVPRKWKKVAALIVQSEGSLQPALESDDRPAVEVPKITDQFDTLE